MIELPILMNTEMVIATLEDRKTCTRRPIKKPFEIHANGYITRPVGNERLCPYLCPCGRIGDLLYVRETWKFIGTNMNRLGRTHYQQDGIFKYKADNEQVQITRPWEDIEKYMTKGTNWKPSIHMPKWAARIWLEITDMRVERVQDITEEQAINEGISFQYKDGLTSHDFYGTSSDNFDIMAPNAYTAYINLWNSIYNNWSDNPWVWVIEFKRIENEK